MLTSMRKGAGSWVAKGFLFLLVMSFAVWGIQGYVGGPVEVTVAEVGGVEVTGTEFRNELQRQMRRLQNQFGQAIEAAKRIAKRRIGADVLRHDIVGNDETEIVGRLVDHTPRDYLLQRRVIDPERARSFGVDRLTEPIL